MKAISVRRLKTQKGAISLGGAAAPAATPFALDASNPNMRRFNVTALDADTGPTAFNHGLSVPTGDVPLAIFCPAVASGTTVVTGNLGATTTATQVTIVKNNLAGSATGLGTIAVLLVWNPHSMIR